MCPPPQLCLSFPQGWTGSPTPDRHTSSCCVMLLAFGIYFERSQMNGWNKNLWYFQFSEMKTKALLLSNLDVLTHGVSNRHPKVREVLVPLGSHSVMTPITSAVPSLKDTAAFWTDDNWSLLKCHHLWIFSSRAAEWPWPVGTHCHHVITLHIRLVVIFTFVIELAEEVESHHSIEVNNHS